MLFCTRFLFGNFRLFLFLNDGERLTDVYGDQNSQSQHRERE